MHEALIGDGLPLDFLLAAVVLLFLWRWSWGPCSDRPRGRFATVMVLVGVSAATVLSFAALGPLRTFYGIAGLAAFGILLWIVDGVRRMSPIRRDGEERLRPPAGDTSE
jgi:hypothetical protein